MPAVRATASRTRTVWARSVKLAWFSMVRAPSATTSSMTASPRSTSSGLNRPLRWR